MGERTHDAVNRPAHYTNGGMECIDEMILIFGREATAHFCLCNAWKYRRRAMYKNGEEDMQKSHWYIARYKELTGKIEWTDWLLIIVGGAIMLAMLAAAGWALDWMVGMLSAIAAR